MQEKILIMDFGSQYTQLIARRLRELNVYCEIYPFNHFPMLDSSVRGVILSGSPCSVNDSDFLRYDMTRLRGVTPVLGICYGAQLMTHLQNGKVQASKHREYGRANLATINASDELMKGLNEHSQVWMSHGDSITVLPEGFTVVATTQNIPVAAFRIENEKTWGIQFHPEVTHSSDGVLLLRNFAVDICGCSADWTPASFVENTIKSLREKLGDDKVVLALSGGVDSSVAALLLHRATGKNLTCVFVDHGLLRKNEFNEVMDAYKEMGLNVTGVNASDKFFESLKDVADPETKRKIIGRGFIEVFDEEAHKLKNIKWLAQGTIYPDVIESVSVNGPSATIKSHHNVGGLPEKMNLRLVEPLRLLFKDEVRRVGKELGLKPVILNRHPFPGPGLAIRVLGEITPKKVALLQEADDIFTKKLQKAGLYHKIWQSGVMLLPVKSVGVMGDERTYEYTVALRAVHSTDGMTADWAHLPYEFLAEVSNEIINKVRGINRVVYDISSKPPATIEWE
ncbi:MAG: glutamine-hydrolyzing GMP synthase [Prevotellaceae bacterium]|jgi:GMP synthase (glutamine-hydrolysing)|nr:glutamine-hydrolyzing GMP synthase [Prevotellaceae bacterium]